VPPPDDRSSGRPRPPQTARGAAGNSGYWDDHNLGEVLFEFRPVGTYMRVNVIHGQTGFETFVMGPRNTSQQELKMLALRKLKTSLNNRKK
jgi:hypothetical protein